MSAPVRILIVDAEPRSRRMLRTLLADEGYRTHEARTAVEALVAVRVRPLIRSLRAEGSTKPSSPSLVLDTASRTWPDVANFRHAEMMLTGHL